MTTLDHATTMTPAGPLTIVAGPDGRVRATGFTADVPGLVALIHPSLRDRIELRERADLGDISARVTSYLDGDLTAIDDVPVRQYSDGAFMTHAWEVMRGIKAGEPVTYTRFAEMAGRPAAIRAAAAACARNAVAFFVPCHRVLRVDTTLGGYRWGLEVKQWLLDHEARR
ncbi:methylated-DNA--[protein]-cysteine S-methyltransferase [Catenuloplanes indicus]|uniref:Methylated-DNA-[protein]-cysteine S-methyltransferase n=1 Tax=Catenuloplanes indicus TaxID=137267 RepID=A0AAE3W561_9ACTN|nr:methylated-DNA--[protein]-cysteine S-methyltransferase [Catenuloplanes indicus]MDQ0368545.1 methylated-DNA-[protein]-cysteine S-methyltransferase [Catenuloplanes indicus]